MCTPLSDSRKARIVAMFDSYCKTVIVNRARNHLKPSRQERHELLVASLEIYAEADEKPEEPYELRYRNLTATLWRKPLYDAFQTLKETEAIVLILKFWERYPDAEIAEYLHVTIRTVRNLKKRAYEKIRKELLKRGESLEVKL